MGILLGASVRARRGAASVPFFVEFDFTKKSGQLARHLRSPPRERVADRVGRFLQTPVPASRNCPSPRRKFRLRMREIVWGFSRTAPELSCRIARSLKLAGADLQVIVRCPRFGSQCWPHDPAVTASLTPWHYNRVAGHTCGVSVAARRRTARRSEWQQREWRHRASGSGRMRVAILGGGVAGLTCAHYLATRRAHAGRARDLRRLGQLGAPIEHEGLRIDRFSNALRNSDTALCGLLGELGGLGRVAWRETRSAVVVDGAFYPRQRPRATCCAPPGSSACQAATGCARRSGSPTRPSSSATRCTCDSVPAAEWLPRVFGRRVFEAWWRPMLESALRRLRPTRFRRTGLARS